MTVVTVLMLVVRVVAALRDDDSLDRRTRQGVLWRGRGCVRRRYWDRRRDVVLEEVPFLRDIVGVRCSKLYLYFCMLIRILNSVSGKI